MRNEVLNGIQLELRAMATQIGRQITAMNDRIEALIEAQSPKSPEQKLADVMGTFPRRWVTPDWLEERDACRDERVEFKDQFPEGLEVTVSNVQEIFDNSAWRDWIVDQLPPKQHREYRAVYADSTTTARVLAITLTRLLLEIGFEIGLPIEPQQVPQAPAKAKVPTITMEWLIQKRICGDAQRTLRAEYGSSHELNLDLLLDLAESHPSYWFWLIDQAAMGDNEGTARREYDAVKQTLRREHGIPSGSPLTPELLTKAKKDYSPRMLELLISNADKSGIPML